jgi:hypothetical protein
MHALLRFLAGLGVLAIVLVVAAAVYFFTGFYNVSALAGGNPALEWAVRNVREASVDTHAAAPAVPQWFSDPKTVAAGAHEFVEEGCVRCHGAPGRKPDKFARGMNPDPPSLAEAGRDDEPGQIFWTIKNGIRMTGMPAFGGRTKDDEIWRAVAFIKHFDEVTPEQFKAWSGGEHGEDHDKEASPEKPSGG